MSRRISHRGAMRRHGKPVPPPELDGSPPTSGLVWHLDASDGVSTSGTDVTGWSDLVGSNDLNLIVGSPQLVAGGAPGGNDYVEFNGVDQALRRGSFSGLPTGATARSMATVARYHSAGPGGITYGVPGANRRVFGTGVRGDGNLIVQVWGPDDFNSGVSANNVWVLHLATVRDDNSLCQRVNLLVHADTVLGTALDTNPAGTIEMGREIDGNPFVEMDVAEVLLYTPELTGPQIAQLFSYISNRYGFSFV